MSSTDRSRARHGRLLAAPLATIAALVLLTPGAASGAMTPELQSTLALTGPDERVPVVATLRNQVDAADYTGRRAALERALRSMPRPAKWPPRRRSTPIYAISGL